MGSNNSNGNKPSGTRTYEVAATTVLKIPTKQELEAVFHTGMLTGGIEIGFISGTPAVPSYAQSEFEKLVATIHQLDNVTVVGLGNLNLKGTHAQDITPPSATPIVASDKPKTPEVG